MQSSRAVVFVALATAFSLLGDQMLYAVLPVHYAAFGLMPYQVGLILSVNRWVRLVANTLAEKLCRRYPVTGLLIAALVLGSALTAAYGVVTSFPVLLIARMLWGLAWSFIRQIGLMTVVETSRPGAIGQRMGYYNGISRLGSVGGNFGGGLAHDVIGFAVALFLFAIISLLGTPLGWLARRAVSREGSAREKPEDAGWVPELMICGFVIGCVGPGIVMSTLGAVLVEIMGTSLSVLGVVIGAATLNGALLSSRWVIDAVSAPFLGQISDRLGRRWSAVIYFSVGVLALLAASIASQAGVWLACVVVFFCCGVGATVVTTAESGLRGSRAVAGYVTAFDLGSATGPMLGWMTQQMALSSDWIFLIGSGMYALGGAVVLCSSRLFSKSPQPLAHV